MDIFHLLLYFFVYGFLGWCTEVGYAAFKEHHFVNRGFLNGPICPIYGVGVTVVVVCLTPYKDNLILLYLSSCLLVTILEGITGWAMDKIFHNKWWDYSKQPLNIGGYVCLPFSLIWGTCCVIIVHFVHPLIDKLVHFLPYTLGMVLLVLLLVAMFADLYVTASAIFKFNKRLESMERIAEELRAKTQEVSDEVKAHIKELRTRYQELGADLPLVSKRLVKAFPKMESRKYKLQLEEFRRKLTKKKSNTK